MKIREKGRKEKSGERFHDSRKSVGRRTAVTDLSTRTEEAFQRLQRCGNQRGKEERREEPLTCFRRGTLNPNVPLEKPLTKRDLNSQREEGEKEAGGGFFGDCRKLRTHCLTNKEGGKGKGSRSTSKWGGGARALS